jgi:hypothetical protein
MSAYNILQDDIYYDLIPRLEKASGKMFHEVSPELDTAIFNPEKTTGNTNLQYIAKQICKLIDQYEGN